MSDNEADIITPLALHIPNLMNMRERCPAPHIRHPMSPPMEPVFRCVREDRLTSLVIHLNDAHAWTREAIADWLDTLDFDLRFSPTPVMDEADTWTQVTCDLCGWRTSVRTWCDKWWCKGCATLQIGPGRIVEPW